MEAKKSVWNQNTADLSWTIVSFSRRALRIPVSPCIAVSFVYLHNFFKTEKTSEYPLSLLLSVSLFLSCKVCEIYRTIDQIYNEISKTAVALSKHVSPEFIVHCLGEELLSGKSLSESEKEKIFSIEVKLLNSTNWAFSFELPFDHINIHGDLFKDIPVSVEERNAVEQSLLKNMCVMMKSMNYLSLDKEVIAAAVIDISFAQMLKAKSASFCDNVSTWMENVKERNSNEFNSIQEYIKSITKNVC